MAVVAFPSSTRSWNTQKTLQQRRSHAGDRSSSSSSPFLVMLSPAQGKPVAVPKLEKEMSKATRRMIRLAQGNLCVILCYLLTKNHKSKSIVGVEGVSQDAILQDEEQMKENQQQVGKVGNWIMHKILS